MVNNPGDLYIVATPIGNLGDMVPRALEVLQRVDWIAAEDTRHSGRLLAHFDITTPMLPYHDHSDDRQSAKILDLLGQGQSVALITDAGTPLISDPGYKLVREARHRQYPVTPVPGCCALVAALCACGIPSDRFSFEGFLPAREGPRQKALQNLARESRTMVFYEAPHRILQTLEDMCRIWGGEREGAIARELTKTHETFLVDTLAGLVVRVAEDRNQQRGEIVIVVRGVEQQQMTAEQGEQLRVLAVLLEDLPVKQAAALTAKLTGGNKKQLYQQAVAIRNEGTA